KQKRIEDEIERAETTTIKMSDELNEALVSAGTAAVDEGTKLAELLRRPQLNYEILKPFDPNQPSDKAVLSEAQIRIKYDGYIRKQLSAAERSKRLESKKIPEDFDYGKIEGLRLEAQAKLAKQRPKNIGEASRISGVSPADITVLLIRLGE
ncbi:MAG: tRNA uridine-5-carboxymethylaminomethyl(34) synthesis enzyme MnmG, partial [Clostridia bacterium]|nr:tRNA uridine-5-carboxymethylaminomethyl(34) synthesis enzyme MnmG [Clostridia bacterium]